MSIANADIAAVFDEIADLLEIENANPFRVRAYRNAAREVNSLGVSAAEMLAKGEDLTELPGIGEELAAKIKEIIETGSCAALEKFRAATPPAVTALLKIPGLGPKRVHALYHGLNVETLEQLAQAARAGRIRDLPGFGDKIERTVLQAIETHVAERGRVPRGEAARYAEPLKRYLEQTPGVKQVVIAGSYRRQRATVGDLDILVAAPDPRAVRDGFVSYSEVKDVLAKGDTRAAVRLKNGLQVDLRVVDEASFGAALQYFTGPKTHNIAIRRRGQKLGLKINEYGVFRGTRRIACDSEESVYRAAGLDWIPPEQRDSATITPAPEPAGNTKSTAVRQRPVRKQSSKRK